MSSGSPSFPIDWRPSRLLCAALAGLGALAALAIGLSALPPALRWILGPAALLHGFWLAARESQRAPCSLRFSADGSRLLLVHAEATTGLSAPRVLVRGPLARVSGRADDGRIWRLGFWPDTLPPRFRRALRLAAGNPVAPSAPELATMSG